MRAVVVRTCETALVGAMRGCERRVFVQLDDSRNIFDVCKRRPGVPLEPDPDRTRRDPVRRNCIFTHIFFDLLYRSVLTHATVMML